MKTFTLSILILLIGYRCFAQPGAELYESALLPEKSGAEVVYSSNAHSFTLNIVSHNIKPLDKPGYVIVDNKILQFVFLPNVVVASPDTSVLKQKEFLLAYMKYETDYVKDTLKVSYTNLEHAWMVIGGKLFLFWYYDMPSVYKSVLKQMNLSTVCFGHAFDLNTPLTTGDKFEINRKLLLDVAATMKFNNFKTGFQELYNKLNH